MDLHYMQQKADDKSNNKANPCKYIVVSFKFKLKIIWDPSHRVQNC